MDGKFSVYNSASFAGLLFKMGAHVHVPILFFFLRSGGESIYGAKFPGKFQFHDYYLR
jgi:hypothetical protein